MAEVAIKSARAFCRESIPTVSPTYTRAAGMTAAKSPPTSARVATKTPRLGANAEITPARVAPKSVRRITRTLPTWSESIPHTGCITP
jgi:hypothetical protein